MKRWIKGVKSEVPVLKSGPSLAGAGAAVIVGLICIAACGNFYLYPMLLLPRHAPPTALFFLFFLLLCGLCGYHLGILFCFGKRKRGAVNAMIFTALSLVFLFLWYVAFFKTFAVLFSLFLMLMALITAVLSLKECISVGCLVPLLAAGMVLLELFYFWITFSVALLN